MTISPNYLSVDCEFLADKKISILYELSLIWIQLNHYHIAEKIENSFIKFLTIGSSFYFEITLTTENDGVLIKIHLPLNKGDFPSINYPRHVNDIMLDYYKALGGEVTNLVLQRIYPLDTLRKIIFNIKLWSVLWIISISIPVIFSFFMVIEGNYRFLLIDLFLIGSIYIIFKEKYLDYKKYNSLIKSLY